jgi:hypothetical protein
MANDMESERKDAIDAFLRDTYNPFKKRLMIDCAEGSALSFGQTIASRLEKFDADYNWRGGYVNDISGKKYSGGLSARKAIQVGLGYGWGDDPASAYVMSALAFCGFWEPKTQEAAVVRELLREIFKLKTSNLELLLKAVKENESEILGTTENPVWLHLIALQEQYDFVDDDVVANTALTLARIDAIAEGSLLKDYELASLAEYLNSIIRKRTVDYSLDNLNRLQLRATIPADLAMVADQ